MRLTEAVIDSPCPAFIGGGASKFWKAWNSTSWLWFVAVAIFSSPYGLPTTLRKFPSKRPSSFRLTDAEMDSPCSATISGGRSRFWKAWNSTVWLSFSALAIRSSPYGLPVTTRKLPSYDPTLFRETDAEMDCP